MKIRSLQFSLLWPLAFVFVCDAICSSLYSDGIMLVVDRAYCSCLWRRQKNSRKPTPVLGRNQILTVKLLVSMVLVWFHYPAMLCECDISYGPVSVCLSVTYWYCVKMVEQIKLFLWHRIFSCLILCYMLSSGTLSNSRLRKICPQSFDRHKWCQLSSTVTILPH